MADLVGERALIAAARGAELLAADHDAIAPLHGPFGRTGQVGIATGTAFQDLGNPNVQVLRSGPWTDLALVAAAQGLHRVDTVDAVGAIAQRIERGQAEFDPCIRSEVLVEGHQYRSIRIQLAEILVQDPHLLVDLFVGDVLRSAEMKDMEHDRDGDHRMFIAHRGVVGDQLADLLSIGCLAGQIAGVHFDHPPTHLVGAATERFLGQRGEGDRAGRKTE